MTFPDFLNAHADGLGLLAGFAIFMWAVWK